MCSHLGRPKGRRRALRDRAGARAPRRARWQTTASASSRTRASTQRETKNDPAFARELAEGCDLYVNDAFGSAHRAHASTEGVAHLLPAYAGLLLLDELEHLGALLGDVEHPFVIVSGGAKVDDKIGVLENLGARADAVLIGGKMAEQVRERESVHVRRRAAGRRRRGSPRSTRTPRRRSCAFDELPDGWLGLDIGPRRATDFAARIAAARTVFWNGPMGVFEWPRFAEGTFAVARALADCAGFTVVGGGDSVRAVHDAGVADRISWISTGGGASLELLEGTRAARRRRDPDRRHVGSRRADRRQLEDVQGARRGGCVLPGAARRRTCPRTSMSSSARRSSR